MFDTIPEQFDKYRSRYSPEQFADLIEYAKIGPGTGQATIQWIPEVIAFTV